jgi:hypothetical protein
VQEAGTERKAKGFGRIALIPVVSSLSSEPIELPQHGKKEREQLLSLHERRKEKVFIPSMVSGAAPKASRQVEAHRCLKLGRWSYPGHACWKAWLLHGFQAKRSFLLPAWEGRLTLALLFFKEGKEGEQ